VGEDAKEDAMAEDIRDRLDREWEELFVKIQEALNPFGKLWDFERREGDYWLIDDNWGNFKHVVEVQNLALLEPVVITALQKVLVGYPDWEITVCPEPPTKGQWPGMALILRDDEIFDELEREYLPKEYQNLTYPGARRARWMLDQRA
jgi:hypothetical protein